MKHCFLKTAMAALFATAAFTVSAANPFADVDTSSWAYQAVSQLSDQGVVEGYPDGTFKGDKNVSRYELAQIIARLMAKEDSLNDSQKAMVQKLSAEYADDLQNLGVRVKELEKKTGNLSTITELRVQDIPRYDNVYKDSKSSHDELSLRVRINTMANVNDRSTVYSQLETYMSMNGKDVYDVNGSKWDSQGNESQREGHGDGDFHMNRLWATYHFGKKQDTSKLPFGPSKNLIGIGQFPVKMGVTGYTYDGQFKGAVVQFGDYLKGGHLTIAYGRATDINYNYTGPMLRGVKVSTVAKNKLLNELQTNDVVREAVEADTTGKLKAMMAKASALISSSENTAALQANLGTIMTGLAQENRDLAKAVKAKLDSANLSGLASGEIGYYNPQNDTLYPMGKDVMMNWGDDEDVPVSYISYIYRKPQQWEFHAYGMQANGPIGNICKAYGFAGAYYITPMWHVQGEYVKNVKKLPLNNERPHSFNYGLHYGTADILKGGSYELGIDYIYSQAGTYFGGSGDDIADQYMGHIYKHWNGLNNVPAYLADKIDALTDGNPSNDNSNYGGAKFFLAKASFVPMRGLIIDAEYGFNAKDMGGRKMDNMFMLKATAYIK